MQRWMVGWMDVKWMDVWLDGWLVEWMLNG